VKTGRIAGITAGFFFKVTIVAILGILLFKFVAGKTKIPGLTSMAQAV
jgi:hypothetical protein